MTQQTPEQRQAHWLRAPIHTYALPLPPKTLLETLCVVESALHALERERPGFNAGGTIESHLERIRLVMDECERMRPTGPDGKHGDRHTPECGCTDKPAVTR
ncbi:hypothetical protein [Nocardioides sp. PD653]|uniref:hypothetical protein n=1 Tax=Nocardioides sp. PD653 TaxID=393303 RepID=UPI0009EFD27B|nr:hypothetical protein [Nocardioides sp. PD653]GAW54717.1 hypothetical protein PD653_2131 [Nocardioides sp. PD653]